MKNIFAIVFIAAASVAVAQKQVVSAFNANKSGDYKAAAGYIEEAITIEKAALKEKTWRYRGEIYWNIANDSALVLEFPNALWVAKESYTKAKELDTKGNYEREINNGLSLTRSSAAQQAYQHYAASEFNLAAAKYDLSAEIAGNLGSLDTLSIWSSAICYEKEEEYSKAKEKYIACGNYNYELPVSFLYAASMIDKTEGREATLAFYNKLRQDFPNELVYVTESVNLFIKDQQELTEEIVRLKAIEPQNDSIRNAIDQNSSARSKAIFNAVDFLESAIALDTANYQLWYSLGVMHYDLSENEALDLEYRENARKEAESAYQKSIQLDSTKFDAHFNLGALYYNRAAHLQTKANDYPIYMNKSQRAEYDQLIADSKEYLQIALGPMEKAFSIKGDDYATIDTLIKIYTRLGASDEKILELNDLLKTL